jgi:hypothetical protein
MMGDQFRGAIPLGDGNGDAKELGTQVVTCIWHNHELGHPPDAPECVKIMHNGKPIRVVPLPALLVWLTVNLTQMLGVSNEMAEHLNELQVYVEALDAREA